MHYYIHIGIFYYTLGNLSPYLRSSLKSIQLVAVVKSKLIYKYMYGVDVILKSFMEQLLELETVRYCYSSNSLKYIITLGWFKC